MTDFLRYLAAVWCFELGGLFTFMAKWMIEDDWEYMHTGAAWLLGSVFLALGWWLA